MNFNSKCELKKQKKTNITPFYVFLNTYIYIIAIALYYFI